jgi:glycine cleavage system H protein
VIVLGKESETTATEDAIMYPTNLRYSKEHEWILVEGETGTIGITEFAQNELGDIVYVELPDVGKQIKGGEVFGTVESVKAVSELYSPVSGEVIEVNQALADAPETVNQDAHGQGWICKVKLSDAAEIEALMDAGAYEELTKAG